MKTQAPQTKRRDAETQSDGSVLKIGMQYFWFDSHEDAGKAFVLLTKATHVRQEYKARQRGPYHDYFPQELIGDISVGIVPRAALRFPKSEGNHE